MNGTEGVAVAIIDQAGRARETTQHVSPPPDLAHLVVEGWLQRYTDAIRREDRAWRIVPDLQPHLIVHAPLGRPPPGPRIVGARSIHLDVDPGRRNWSAGVTLRPGALPLFTGLPGSDLTDRSAGAEEIWGRGGSPLQNQVAGVGRPSEVFPILWRFLRARLDGEEAVIDWRVRGVLALSSTREAGRISALAREMGVSPRTLRSAWRDRVGLSPRESLSIRRLHRAVTDALEEPARPWSRVARAAGFYDQSHLIRDFHRYLGETPEAFLARRNGATG